jgi:cytochrome c2
MKGHATISLALAMLASPALAQIGNPVRGEREFRACAPCHSLEPDRNMTGPSLANLLGAKGGRPAELGALLRCPQVLWNHLG